MSESRYMYGVTVEDADIADDQRLGNAIYLAIKGYWRHVVKNKTPDPKDGQIGWMMSNELMSKLQARGSIEGGILAEHPVISSKNITKNSLYFGRIR